MSARAGQVKVGLSLMPSEDARLANEELYEANEVDAIEWSVDFGFAPAVVPDWLSARVADFARRGCAYAHGVELSPMSARLMPQQDEWLAALAVACKTTPFRHLTEHYGFMTAGDFVRGTPLPLPPSRAALAIAARRIELLRETSGLAVGIENLAFAFSRTDVLAQADFMRELLEQSGAFLLLDVHNLYCQAHNFELDALDIARLLPLEHVREIHVAGGGQMRPAHDPQGRLFRRDSHDAAAPEPLFPLLAELVPRCPALEVVILERSDRSLFGRDEAAAHRAEFRRLRALVHGSSELRMPPENAQATTPSLFADDSEASLDAFQTALLGTFARERDATRAKSQLLDDARLAPYRSHIKTYEPRAVEVAITLVRQWATRAPTEPSSMLAAVFRAPNAPLELENLPVPVPGPQQVLLRATAVGLCGTDAHAFAGRFPVPTPIVLGHETVGVVVAVGSAVTRLMPGDRVGVSWVQAGCGLCEGCRRGTFARCAEPRTWVENGGGLSELVIAEASGCTRLPEALDDEHAAPMLCAGHVAMSGYRRALPQPGERIAVLGIGGLGHLAIQIAKAFGHEVIAVSPQRDKLLDARELGADRTAHIDGDAGKAIERAGGADIVLATTSHAASVAQAVTGLRTGGRIVMMGLATDALQLDALELVQREASIVGAIQGPLADLVDVLELAASGAVRARIETYPLILVQRALDRLVEGRVRYRAVISG